MPHPAPQAADFLQQVPLPEATVEVVKKEYFAADEVPLPMEKTKHIIRKCTKDDFDLPKE